MALSALPAVSGKAPIVAAASAMSSAFEAVLYPVFDSSSDVSENSRMVGVASTTSTP